MCAGGTAVSLDASSLSLRYRLGKPSREYEPLIKSLMTCVGYAKKIQLFMVDVVGTDEGNEDLGLDFLLDMMTDSGMDRDFIIQHGNELFELLCELQMEKTLPFMVELVSWADVMTWTYCL